jgi:hypothetical protein
VVFYISYSLKTDQNHKEYSMDNHGKPNQINGAIVHNITKFPYCGRLQLDSNIEPNTYSLLKKRKELFKKVKKRKERKSMHKACYYSWACYCSLRTLLTSFKLGDMEQLRTGLRILVSFGISGYRYSGVPLGGDIFG